VTGIFLAFYYVPDAAGNPAPAYLSVRDVIDNQVYLAWLISMLRLGLGAVILPASLMCFLGTSWDIHWHTLIGRNRSLIPPHEIMLRGVALSGIAATADIVLETIWADCAHAGRLLGGRDDGLTAEWCGVWSPPPTGRSGIVDDRTSYGEVPAEAPP